MPFTLAHPAMAIPLCGPLKRLGALSALIIGSMVPDIAYFSPIDIARRYSHSGWGLLWFCVPLGLLCWGIFHWILKSPLMALLPSSIQRKLGRFCRPYATLRDVPWLAVLVSLFLGAATHLFWDSFTHSHTPLLVPSSILNQQLFAIGGYRVEIHFFLQQFSSIVGLLLLSVWLVKWLRAAPSEAFMLPFQLKFSTRVFFTAVLLLGPLAVGMYAGSPALYKQTGLFALHSFAGVMVLTSLPLLSGGVITYAVGWHLYRKLKYRAWKLRR